MSHDFVRRLPLDSFARSSFGRLGQRFHIDMVLMLLLTVTCAYGLLVLDSAVNRDSASVISQLMKLGVAMLIMIIMAQIPPVFYLRIAPWLYLGGLAMLVMVLFFGYVFGA